MSLPPEKASELKQLIHQQLSKVRRRAGGGWASGHRGSAGRGLRGRRPSLHGRRHGGAVGPRGQPGLQPPPRAEC